MNERGQTTVLILGLALVCFAVAGVAVDGTRAFIYRRTLQSSADSAALAGASALDADRYYRSGGKRVSLGSSARLAAAEELRLRGLPARPTIILSGNVITVTLRGEVSTSFLSLVGIDAIPVAVEAVAEPIVGQ